MTGTIRKNHTLHWALLILLAAVVTTTIPTVVHVIAFTPSVYTTSSFNPSDHTILSSSTRRRQQQRQTAVTTTLHVFRNKEDKTDTKAAKKSPNQVFDPLNLSSTKETAQATTFSSQQDPQDLILMANNDVDDEKEKDDNQQIGIWAARALLLLVAAIWGTNFASVKYLENLCFHPPCHHPPSEAAFARFGVAALVSLPLLFKQRWDVIRAGLECGSWITLGYVSQALALSTISSGKCAFICSLTVIVVPILSAVLYGKEIKPMNIVAAFIALSGVGVLEGMIDFNDILGIKAAVADTGGALATTVTAATTAAASSSVETAAASMGPLASIAKTLGVGKGDILALGQPIGFGYCFLRIEHYQEQFKDVPNRVLTIAAAQCVAVGVWAALWVLHDYNWSFPDFSYMIEPHRLAAIGWTGIVTTVFAIFLEGIALQTATATDAAISFSSEPVWATLFGFILLGEQLNTSSYIGGALILMACLVGAISDIPKSDDEAKELNSESFSP